MEKITSIQNPKVKNIIKLSKAKERKLQNLFLVEGARELSLAISTQYKIKSVFVCFDLFSKSDYPDVLKTINPRDIVEVSSLVFEKIAYREGSDGILALVEPKSHTLADLSVKDNPFIIVLESIEKPGNLGAILRTADAAAVDAIVVCDPLTDIYNPNVVRSSVGCLFTVPIAVATSDEALKWLKLKQIKLYAAQLNTCNWYQNMDYTQAAAIVMGTEANGLTDFWIDNADTSIKIPMRGKIDSLNVSISTAIISFEAMRQRGFV